jgi:hypothetical protein
MTNIKSCLINMYIIVVLTLFGYVCWSRLNIADNYFAVAMFMLES